MDFKYRYSLNAQNFSSEMRKQLKMSFSIEYFIVIYKKETMAEVILKDSWDLDGLSLSEEPDPPILYDVMSRFKFKSSFTQCFAWQFHIVSQNS